MKQDTILSVEGLHVSLGGRLILEDISFQVSRGQTIALLGPNGSGKSTLFRALLGLIPYQGTVAWQPHTRIGYVPQTVAIEHSLPLTVSEFFGLKGVRRGAMEHALRDVGLLENHGDTESLLHQPLGTLSGGQLQRALIAWTIADEPSVLLFDEPTSGIDVGGQQNIYSLLDSLKKERNLTILLISHDLHVVFSHADIVFCINKSMTCNGVPAQVLDAKSLAALYGNHISLYLHDH